MYLTLIISIMSVLQRLRLHDLSCRTHIHVYLTLMTSALEFSSVSIQEANLKSSLWTVNGLIKQLFRSNDIPLVCHN